MLTTLFVLMAATPALASSVGVHLHEQPGTTGTSSKIVADIYGGSQYYITSFSIDAELQPGDSLEVRMQTYEQWNSGSSQWAAGVEYDSTNSFPTTYNVSGNDVFAAWIVMTTDSGNNDCSLAYFSSMTNNTGNSSTFDPITCSGGTDPQDPPPPPNLPPPPVIPEAPTYVITQPTLPTGDITVPGPGSFDGTYDYEEPAREGAFEYTPPPLNIPEPIPSPPPPPAGPGIFDFTSIMQPLGTPDGPGEVEQPTEVNAPREPDQPLTGETPRVVESPAASDAPMSPDTPHTVDPVSASTPVGINPVRQADTPIMVQPAEIQPALVQEPIPKDDTLVSDEPLVREPPSEG